ncbi:MAG TPA: holo-ACP synthase, partial [Waddliaceae bacterium]
EYCLSYHRDASRRFAGRFAAKEAVVKALGVGIGQELSWTDIEVMNDGRGKPHVIFSDHAKDLFDSPLIEISISHCKTYAMAVAIWLVK